VGKTAGEAVSDGKGKTIVKAGTAITPTLATRISKLPVKTIKVAPFVSNEIIYFTAEQEDEYTIAQANSKLDQNNQFVDDKVEVRLADRYLVVAPEDVELMDVSPKQIVSVATALIPFLEQWMYHPSR